MDFIHRHIEKFTPYFLVFVAGLACGYAWCAAAFNLFAGGR